MLTSSEFLWHTFSTCIYLFNWPLQYICIIKTGTWIHCYIWPSQLSFYWDENNVASYWSIHFVTTAHIPETPSKQSTNEPWKWVAEHSQKCYGTPSSKSDYCTDLHLPSCNMQHTWRNVHGQKSILANAMCKYSFKDVFSDFCPLLSTIANNCLSPPSQRRSHNHLQHSRKHNVGKEN